MHAKQSRNARFWVYVHGGPVKLTLKPGQTLAWSTGGPTDEGYYRNSERWENDGFRVIREWSHDGRDCDGRLTRYGEDYATLEELHEVEPYYTDEERPTWAGVKWPNWRDLQAGQYDEFAEAAGY